MYPKRSIQKCACLCGLSAFLLIFGIVIICIRTLLYNAILSKMTVLGPELETFAMWKQNPVPLTLKLYLFNWTNAAEMNNSAVKPRFQELGPYTFDETKEKVNITWNANNNTVSFYHLKKWWFEPHRSNGSLSDPVTSVDPVALSSAVTTKDWNYFLKKGINVLLGSVAAKAYSTHSAGDILFDGYDDAVLTMATKMPSLGNAPPFDKFGWFYTRNNSETYEGHYNMDTGVTGQLGELYSWKHMQYTPYYNEHCGKVWGSAGEFFPTNLQKESIIRFFSPDLCRYVELEFEKEVVISGLLGYKYVAGDRFLDNGTKIPENKCFCKGNCMPYGALDISACRYGSPAYVSLPHFHKADPYYTSLIEGVKSNNDSHDFFMIFEPKTGLPLQVSARLQVNLLLQPVPGITIYANAPKVYVPILWFEQSVLLPEDLIFYVTLIINFEVVCLAVGVILIFLSVLLEICCCYRIWNTSLFKRQAHIITREEIPLNQKKEIAVQVGKKKVFS